MAGLYLAGAWLVLQVSGTVLPMLDAPAWLPRTVMLLLLIGFLPAMLFAWVFELTPEGLKRDADVPPEQALGPQTAQRMEHLIVVVLALALGYFAFDKFVLAPTREAALVAATRDQATKPLAVDKSIAVLPFANTSGDPDNEYFSDGLSEEMIGTLGKLRDLKVIGRNSSFQFKGRNEDPKVVAAKLGVAYLLAGSVRKAGDQVRIAVELVKAADGSNVWSQSYDRELRDIFAVQSEIASAVAQQLQATLLAQGSAGGSGTKPLQPDAPPSGNVEAFNALLQGNFYDQRRTPGDLLTAIGHYQRAVALDPGYALAWARLSSTQTTLVGNFTQSITPAQAKTAREGSRQAAAEALRLAPDGAEAHLAQGYALDFLDNDPAAAEPEYRRAVALAPQNPVAVLRLAVLRGMLGHLEEAQAGVAQAAILDPLSARTRYNLALMLMGLGRFQDAEIAVRKAIELQPQAAAQHAYLVVMLIEQGKTREALASAAQETDGFYRDWALALAHWAAGNRAASDAALATILRNHADDAGSQIASVYAQRKQPDEMFRWLEHARETGDGGVVEIRFTPFFGAYKDDPRFIAFARKVGVMPAEAIAGG